VDADDVTGSVSVGAVEQGGRQASSGVPVAEQGATVLAVPTVRAQQVPGAPVGAQGPPQCL
jgi:hypothetical protein